MLKITLKILTCTVVMCSINIFSTDVLAQTYNNSDLGLSITIDDYFSQKSQEGDVYYFTAADNASTVIVKNQPGLSVAEIKQAGKQGYQDEDISLTVSGKTKEKIVKQGWGLVIPVEGYIEMNKVKGVMAAYVGHKGQGFVVLVVSSPDSWKTIEPRSQKILKSIRFIKYTGGQGIAKWKKYLTGQRVAYRSTRGGMSAREDYSLCSDGTFIQSSGSSGYTDGSGVSVYAHGSNNGSGRWRLQSIAGKPHIIFNYYGGDSEEYSLEDRGGQTWLNGTRYFVVENNQCQ